MACLNFHPIVMSNTELSYFSDLQLNLIGAICNPSPWVCSYCEFACTNNDTLAWIYLEWKSLCAYLCQNWQYFCNSDRVNCAFCGVFRELLGGNSQIWRSK
jgi:hypothetical protein